MSVKVLWTDKKITAKREEEYSDEEYAEDGEYSEEYEEDGEYAEGEYSTEGYQYEYADGEEEAGPEDIDY